MNLADRAVFNVGSAVNSLANWHFGYEGLIITDMQFLCLRQVHETANCSQPRRSGMSSSHAEYYGVILVHQNSFGKLRIPRYNTFKAYLM